jgi:predicted transcriptional regulator
MTDTYAGSGPPGSGFVISLNPEEMANRFAAPPPYEEEPDDPSQPKTEVEKARAEGTVFFEQFLERIPKREADAIFLFYIQGKRQSDIAVIFGITQAAVSYRLQRAVTRIKFLMSVPIITEEDIRRDLTQVFRIRSPYSDPWKELLDVNILVEMWRTTCQSETAERLKTTQGRVRHRFFRLCGRLKDLAEGPDGRKYIPYRDFFAALQGKKAYNIMRTVTLPQWAGKGTSHDDRAEHRKPKEGTYRAV